jgi:hypothetical protein
MAHFAKIGLNNEVIEVVVVSNRDTMNYLGEEDENIGIEFLKNLTGHQTWLKCSYRTHANNHNNGTPFRKNFPSAGYTYNAEIDGFVPPKPNDQFEYRLDADTGQWLHADPDVYSFYRDENGFVRLENIGKLPPGYE